MAAIELMDNENTEQATQSAEPEAESAEPETSFIDRDTTAAPDLAWSQDKPDQEPQRHSWRATWALIAVCSAVAAGGVSILLWVNRSHHTPAPKATATPTISAAPAPPPTVTQTVSAAPPQQRQHRF